MPSARPESDTFPLSPVLPLDAQVVLVSGGSRGVGAAIARAFHREGARVVVNYFRSRGDAEGLADELGERAMPWQANVRVGEEVQAMVEAARSHFGDPVTTVVSNALVDYRFDPADRDSPETLTWDHYLAQLEGSVRAALHLVQATRPGMREVGGGRVITIGSNLVQHPVVPYHDYTTGKAALLGFTRNMAADLGPEGITVNMVSGGLLDRTDASAATSDEVFELIRQSTPLRRVTTPAELADAVVFLASPWARGITGQNLIVDGGLVMG